MKNIEILPDGEPQDRVDHQAGNIEGFIGLLAGQTDKIATLDEMNNAIEEGWAGLE